MVLPQFNIDISFRPGLFVFLELLGDIVEVLRKLLSDLAILRQNKCLVRYFPVTGIQRFGAIALNYQFLFVPGVMAYASYYLILMAYQMGGEVAAVTAVRQASIPISVMLGGLFLREGSILRRLFAALLLTAGIVVIIVLG